MKNNTIIAIAALTGIVGCHEVEETDQKPNIIYILTDDLGYNDLGSFGSELIKTPVLDQMAEDGMRFTQHYAGSAVCAPSRSVLMTGLHSGNTPVRGNRQVEPSGQMPLPENTVTIATLLKDAGYTTGLIGKWGLGVVGTTGEPNKHGFDHYFGYLDQVLAHNHTPGFLIRNGEKVMLDNVVEYRDTSEWHKGLGSYPVEMNEFSQDLFTQEAIEFVENNQNDPFFLYYPVIIPHDNGEALPGKRYSEVPSFGIYENMDWTEEEKGYAAMITYLDEEIGKLLDKLTELNLDENTLVIFTSDNGGQSPGRFLDISNYPYRGIKRQLYEGGIRVPMIARWTGTIEPGTVSNHMSAFWDVMPTFCNLAEIPTPEFTDGISFLPELTGKEQKQHEYLYWEFHEQDKKQAVRKGKWKAVRNNVAENPFGPIELYDLEKDPSENTDISFVYPEVVNQLTQLIDNTRSEDPNWEF
ncbi:MAG: arylsulfatase [Bacteroidales bacterium]